MNTEHSHPLLDRLQTQRGIAFGVMIVVALLAFEIFNYSTTDFALHDLLGDLKFIGLRWSTILAVAFCGIDFAGIARIFTPEEGRHEPAEVWYLFGAWLIAATMNALLTWWGISIALLGQADLGNAVLDQATLVRVVPIFIAILVWLSRLLLIGSFSIAGERLFTTAPTSGASANPFTASRRSAPRTARGYTQPQANPTRQASPRDPEPAQRPSPYIRPNTRK